MLKKALVNMSSGQPAAGLVAQMQLDVVLDILPNVSTCDRVFGGVDIDQVVDAVIHEKDQLEASMAQDPHLQLGAFCGPLDRTPLVSVRSPDATHIVCGCAVGWRSVGA